MADEPKKYTPTERQTVNLKAKRKLGLLKKDSGPDPEWMDQCVSSLMDSGEFEDEADAEAVCEVIWDEGGGD
jgi:hypothetical protein